jgi:methyltransferase
MNGPALLLAGLVALLRLAELWYAERNTRALRAQGAIEVGRGHYPLLVLLHASWLIAIPLAAPRDAVISWPLLAIFLGLQVLRLWVLLSLGRFWTTRIITLSTAPLIRRGVYRFLKHPNYLVVSAEILVLPLVVAAWPVALLFSILNAALLAWRIHVENGALAGREPALAHHPLTTQH